MSHLRDEVRGGLRNDILDEIFSREMPSITSRLPLSGQNAYLFCDDLRAHTSQPSSRAIEHIPVFCARFSLDLAAKHL